MKNRTDLNLGEVVDISIISLGADQIPVRFIKSVANDLASPLTHIKNACIETSTFPSLWKISRISPIPKVESPVGENDFRLVSILPALSKIFERLELRQLITLIIIIIIEKAAFFGHRMSGFRKGHSTTTALIGIRDDLKRSMNRGEVSLMVFADYSKAFDTVRLSTALKRMHRLGFSGSFLKWMINYLSDRRHFVQIDDRRSDMAHVAFGVPQGSILGPVIFNLHVAYLQNNVNCQCFQYEDDTTLYIHSKVSDLSGATTDINHNLNRLGEYSNESNLALNATITKWMLVSTSQMSRHHSLDRKEIDIKCNGKALERVNVTKLLGVHLDSHLDWKEHVTKLLSSCYGPFKVRKQLAECLVLSKLNYCNTIFHPLHEYQIKRLQRVQNTCAAFVLRHHAKSSHVINLNWLPIRERTELSLLKLTHKSLYYEGWPKHFQLEFQRSCSYNLRSSDAPRLSVPRETDTFKSMAARSFNSLPDSVRHLTDYYQETMR